MNKIIRYWIAALALTGFSILGLTSCNVAESGESHILRMQLHDSLAVESNLFKSIDIDLFDSSGNMTHADVFNGPYHKADAEKLANLVVATRIPNPVTIKVTAHKDSGEYWVFTIKVADGIREVLPPVNYDPSKPVVPNPADSLAPTRILITSPATPTLYLGDPSISLSAIAEPSTAIQTITWTLSSGDAALLEAGNKLKAMKAGTVTLMATSARAPSVSATLELTIMSAPTVPPASVVIGNPSPLSLTVGGASVALNASVLPVEAKQDIKWTLPSNTVAILEPGNMIKGLTAGTVTLTASSAIAPSVFDTLVVTVQDPPAVLPTSITLASPALTLLVGAPPVALEGTVSPPEASQNLIWTFDAPGVVEIVNNNQIKGLKSGTAKVTATSAVKSSVTAVLDVVVETPVVAPESLSLLMPTPMVLAVGGADGDLLWSVLPAGAGQGVDWSSSDTSVAQIIGGDKVRPLKKGAARITGKSKVKPTIMATFDISVIVPVQVDAINIMPKTLTVYTGGPEGKLAVTLTGNDSGAQFTLASSDAAIATVSATGSVKGLAAGSAVITASVVGYPAITSSCSVKVVKDSPVVTVSANQNIAFNGEAVFTVSVAPQALGTTVEIKADMDGDNVFEQTVLNKESAEFKQKYTEVKTTTVSFKVKDTEGNEETITRKVTVGAPGAPMVSIVNPSKDTTINVLSLKIRFNVKDTALKTDIFVDSTVTLVAGSNKIRAARTNIGGAEGSDELTILVDNTAPTVAIDGAATRTTGAAAFTVTGTASDLSSGLQSVSITGAISGNGAATVTAGEWSKGLTLAEGENTLVATALDKAGNTKTASITVTLDSKKPAAPSINAPTVGAVRAGPITWTWTTASPSNGSGKFKVKVNGGSEIDVAVSSYTLAAANMTDGTVYGLSVKETDPIAGDGPWSAEKKVLYDSKKPDPSISVSLSATKDPTWTWKGNGGVGTFRWYFKATTPTYLGNNSPLLTYKTTVAAATDATYNLCVQEKDSPEWGEEWGAEKCASIRVDKKAPVITNVSVSDGFITSQKTAGLKIQFTVDGAATPSEATCTLMHDNNDIANTCTITASDDAENTATVNRSVWWRKNVVFVNKSATGSQDGTTWKTAYRELHTALNPGTNWPIGTEIWVAEGNYGHAPDPAYEIQVKPHNISIFGGFNKAGTATKKADRTPASTKSIISTPVVISEGADNVIWEGFHHEYSTNSAHIMFSIGGRAAQIRNCNFTSLGGGFYSAISTNGDLTKIANCKFSEMWVQMGAIAGGGSAEISGVTASDLENGPALYISQGGSWTVTGSTFQNNFGQGTDPYNIVMSGSAVQGGKASIIDESGSSFIEYGSNNTPSN